MLILSRRRGERIMIGDDVIITLVSIVDRNKVRIGIEARKDVTVLREELYNKRKEQKDADDHQ